MSDEIKREENKAEETEIAEKEPLFFFEYKVSVDESAFAIDRFFSRFMIKTNVLYTVIFGILSVLYLIMAIKNPSKVLYYALLAACLAVIAGLWIKPSSRKKQYLAALEAVKDDLYICDVWEKKIKIQTVIPEEEQTEDRIKNPLPRIIDFTKDFVQAEEYEKLFLMFVQKETTFIFPKEAIGKDVSDKLREFFTQSCGEEFVIHTENK